MRFRERNLSAGMLLNSTSTLELIESYPGDKYLPSYLVRGEHGATVFHALIAADLEADNIRVVTMYSPHPSEWDNGYRTRRIKR